MARDWESATNWICPNRPIKIILISNQFLPRISQSLGPCKPKPLFLCLATFHNLSFFVKKVYKLSVLTALPGLHLSSEGFQVDMDIKVFNKMCVFFCRSSVFCQFNPQAPATELRGQRKFSSSPAAAAHAPASAHARACVHCRLWERQGQKCTESRRSTLSFWRCRNGDSEKQSELRKITQPAHVHTGTGIHAFCLLVFSVLSTD